VTLGQALICSEVDDTTLHLAGQAYFVKRDLEFSKHCRSIVNKANIVTQLNPSSEELPQPDVSTVEAHRAEHTVSPASVAPEIVTEFGKELEFIVPYNVSDRLSEIPTRCISTLVKDGITRCRAQAKRRDLLMVESLQALEESFSRRNHTTLFYCISEILGNAMCGNHYRTATSDKRIDELRRVVEILPDRSTSRAKDRAKDEVKDEVKYEVEDEAENEVDDEVEDLNLWLDKIFTTLFEPYQPGRQSTKGNSTSLALHNLLEKPLQPKTDLDDGFIYMFRYAGLSGHLKIGRSGDIHKRLLEWNRQCKRDHELLKPSYDSELVKVPHVNRVEKLVHAELQEFRKSTKTCTGCGKKHDEWFEVDEDHAMAVFMKWKKWIKTSPYEQNEKGEWRLRKSEMKGLHKVCEPIEYTGKAPRK